MTSLHQSELRRLEEDMLQAREAIKVAEALRRLMESADFKLVIQRHYFHEEPVRLVHLKGELDFQTAERQASILKQMDAISSLRQYFERLEFSGRQAEKALVSQEEARDQIFGEIE